MKLTTKGRYGLRAVIDLAKSLGMRIVQEGVETEEIFNKVKGYGCDVAQGFYYAKAIPLEEYRIFIDTNTSIVYKSKVKEGNTWNLINSQLIP